MLGVTQGHMKKTVVLLFNFKNTTNNVSVHIYLAINICTFDS